jgi:hypothetical protein
MAVCRALSVVALANATLRAIQIFELPSETVTRKWSSELERRRILWLPCATLPRSTDRDGSALCLAFTTGPSTGSAQRPLLLVSDQARRTVHVMDVVDGQHVGYVGDPGGMKDVGCVACWGDMAAVCTDDQVALFKGCGSAWVLVSTVRVSCCAIDYIRIRRPRIRFTAGGAALAVLQSRPIAGVAVVDIGTGRVVEQIRAAGRTKRPALQGRKLFEYQHRYDWDHLWDFDVADCGGGWVFLVSKGDLVTYLAHARANPIGLNPEDFRLLDSIEVVSGVGVVGRERRIQYDEESIKVYPTPAVLAQAAMSAARVVWMGAVARGVFARATRRVDTAVGGSTPGGGVGGRHGKRGRR